MIAVAGELDLATAPALRHFIDDVRRAPADQLIFDMAGVAFVDSSGLRVLLDAYVLARRHGGAVHLAALSGAPARLVEITRLGERFRLHPTTATALAAVLAAPEAPGSGDGAVPR
uniref:Anti-sigma factor antagonist n=1 Tax=Nonomuraea gerenzanensis TaxID=93944 RepID=A0A1M4EA43_9ACTN|nr:Anti-sigma F factor antagonist (spoIIAA-2); Anti-sigma B factor antagonist RsbV [Nonomuraea gerenzanensis]